MSEEPNANLWLQLGVELSKLVKLEPPEVQQAMKEISRKTYPETAKARREREQEETK